MITVPVVAVELSVEAVELSVVAVLFVPHEFKPEHKNKIKIVYKNYFNLPQFNNCIKTFNYFFLIVERKLVVRQYFSLCNKAGLLSKVGRK